VREQPHWKLPRCRPTEQQRWMTTVPRTDDTIKYQITDADGDISEATVTVHVTSVDDFPTANDDVVNVNEDSTLKSNVTGNDVLSGDGGNVWAKVTNPAHGTVIMNSDGTYSYIPEANYNGTDSFTYSITDADGDSDTATVNIVVNDINDGPVAKNDSVVTNEDTSVEIDITDNDTDIDGTIDVGSVTITQNPVHGTVTINPTSGKVTYVPEENYHGTDSFKYTVKDDDGAVSNEAIVDITVNSVNDIPNSVQPIADRNSEDNSGINLDLSPYFQDADGDALTFSVTGLPDGLHMNSEGIVEGTINHSASQGGEEGSYSVQVTATDPEGQTATDTFIWTVVNPAPIAMDNEQSITEDKVASGNVIMDDDGYGLDSDPDGDSLSVASFMINEVTYPAGAPVSIPEIGTITIQSDGSYNFVPVTDYYGDVPPILYTLTDGEGGTDTATLSLKVEQDTDGDGIVNEIDLDDDNDGILDTIEEATATNSGDTDNDGIPDIIDLDSDNDGITDLEESNRNPEAVDSNHDGVLDSTTDIDQDGVMDTADANDNDPTSPGVVDPVDTDSDGKPDFQDIDSDNDGLSDLVEGGSSPELDSNNDGILDDDTDSDADGIADSVDPDNGGTLATTPDTDADGIDDYRDLDSDNDGINDVDEAGGTDTDGNGLDDTPNETLADPLTDIEDNGIPDTLEPNNPHLPAIFDPDGNGVIDGSEGTDTDGDGIPDVVDGSPDKFADSPIADADSDGIPDEEDIDDDNDGIPDLLEEKGTAGRDTDGDGIPDSLDLDSDNDGILDIVEAGGVDLDSDGRVDEVSDSDHDGLADIVDVRPEIADDPQNIMEARAATTLPVPDTDSDGKPDFQDVDSDNDGLSDVLEGGNDPAMDYNNDGRIEGDVDKDGIVEGVVPSTAPDTDDDGRPDYRDLDSDNDGLTDIREADKNLDTDGNGLVDHAGELVDPNTIPDENGDGILDILEPNNPDLPGYIDENGDGIIDNPADRDDDGIPDVVDGTPDGYGHDKGLKATYNHETVRNYEGTPIDVLGNGDTYIVLSDITYTQPAHGSVKTDDRGTANDPTDDLLIYTPYPDSNHLRDEFVYTIKDAEGRTSEALVTLDLQCTSSQPSDNGFGGDGGDALSKTGILLMLFLTLLTGLYFVKQEEERGEKQ